MVFKGIMVFHCGYSIIQGAIGMYPGYDDSKEVPDIQPGDEVIQEISQNEDIKNKKLVEWDSVGNVFRQQGRKGAMLGAYCMDRVGSDMFAESFLKA